MNQLAVLMAAMAFASACVAPTWAKDSAVTPATARTPQPAPALTVDQVLARSWAGEGGPLRDQLAWNDATTVRDDSFDAFEAERAAIRGCQNERYIASRDGLLDGVQRPLRDC